MEVKLGLRFWREYQWSFPEVSPLLSDGTVPYRVPVTAQSVECRRDLKKGGSTQPTILRVSGDEGLLPSNLGVGG